MSDFNQAQKILAQAMKENDLTPDEIAERLAVPRETPRERARSTQMADRSGGRVPMSGQRLKLEVLNKDPNYHYRWFLMVGDRVQKAMRAGYVPVLEGENSETGEGTYNPDSPAEEGQWVTKIANRRSNTPESAVLMKQPLEFHQEDKAYKAQQVEARTQGIQSHKTVDPRTGKDLPDQVTYGDPLKMESEFIR